MIVDALLWLGAAVDRLVGVHRSRSAAPFFETPLEPEQCHVDVEDAPHLTAQEASELADLDAERQARLAGPSPGRSLHPAYRPAP